MKFTKDRILVSLTENPEAHTVTISVEDNGTGIKPTEKEKIFNLFYQSANKPQLPNKGFGIGLAIVSLLVKRMMGKIEVESEEKPVYPFPDHASPERTKRPFYFCNLSG